MDDLLSEFLTETSESLAVLDVELVKFEQDPSDEAILGNIFRLVHTIKGTCGFLGLPRLESVAHAGENVLGKSRDGVIDVSPEAVTLILKCLDCIRELLSDLEENGEEPEGEDQALIDELNAMADGGTASAPAAEAAPAEEAPAAETAPAEAGEDGSTPTNDFGAPVAQELLDEVEAAQTDGAQAATQTETEAEAEGAADEVKAAPAQEAKVPAKAEQKAPAKKKEEGKTPKESSIAAQSIRVNVDVLEDLMTQVSELVLTRNQLMQLVRGRDQDDELTASLQRLSHITSDLQEGVMKTRMQPICNAWAKLPRIVRDLSLEQDKQIELVMVGAETELDRQVLELIKDPLTHMVRNSADHGVEMPADRAEIGKPEKGTIELRAFHEGGHIIIEIDDDGRGLNMERIREKALENGLATDAELESMSDQQIQQFILAPGFSTAAKVTSISGRGVGMDVVKTNIEKIGGTIELKSVAGKGSTFTIKIPLTLAIVSALIVECAKQRFAIPQISVLELVRASTKSDNAIEMISDSPVLRLRNRLLPLVSLQNLLDLKVDVPLALPEPESVSEAQDQDQEQEQVAESEGSIEEDVVEDFVEEVVGEVEDTEEKEQVVDDETFIVVTQVGTNTFGIIVDQVFDTEEIVVKPVAPILHSLWRSGARAFFKDHRAKNIGDIVTVVLDLADSAVFNNKTTRDRADSETTGVPFLLGLEAEFNKVLPQAVTPATMMAFNDAHSTSGDGVIERDETLSLTFAAVVTQILPNGSLVIVGRQEILVNSEVRELMVTGVIRPSDIDSDNTISDDNIAEMRVAYGGSGTLSQLQQPRWGTQIWDIIFPF